MSVGLYVYDGSIYDDDSKVILSESIATESIYKKYLEPAMDELKIKFLRDGAEIRKKNLSVVLEEIEKLKTWCIDKFKGTEIEYLTERMENLENVIPQALQDDDAIMYIF